MHVHICIYTHYKKYIYIYIIYLFVYIYTNINNQIYVCIYSIYVVHSTYIYFCIHILIFARFLLSRKSLEIFESLLATPVCKGNHIPYVTHTFSVKVFK